MRLEPVCESTRSGSSAHGCVATSLVQLGRTCKYLEGTALAAVPEPESIRVEFRFARRRSAVCLEAKQTKAKNVADRTTGLSRRHGTHGGLVCVTHSSISPSSIRIRTPAWTCDAPALQHGCARFAPVPSLIHSAHARERSVCLFVCLRPGVPRGIAFAERAVNEQKTPCTSPTKPGCPCSTNGCPSCAQ